MVFTFFLSISLRWLVLLPVLGQRSSHPWTHGFTEVTWVWLQKIGMGLVAGMMSFASGSESQSKQLTLRSSRDDLKEMLTSLQNPWLDVLPALMVNQVASTQSLQLKQTCTAWCIHSQSLASPSADLAAHTICLEWLTFPSITALDVLQTHISRADSLLSSRMYQAGTSAP